MLQPRWKIFRVLNVLLIVSAVLLASSILYDYAFATIQESVPYLYKILYIFLQILGYGILITNSIINLVFITRYNTSMLPPKWLRQLSFFLFFPTLLLVAFFTYGQARLIVSLIKYIDYIDRKLILKLVCIVCISLSGLCILWNQLVLRRQHVRNNRAAMENFLEEEPPALK